MKKIIHIIIIIIIIFCLIILHIYLNSLQNKILFINGLKKYTIIKKTKSINEVSYIDTENNKIINIKKDLIVKFNDSTNLLKFQLVYNYSNNLNNNSYKNIIINNEKNGHSSVITKLITGKSKAVHGPEDPRIIKFKNDILIIYNDTYINGQTRMFVYNMTTNKNILLKYNRNNLIEKNWSPFIYKDELYVSYFLNPHTILKIDLLDGNCTEIFSNPKIVYPYNIYGGTPSILIPELNMYFGMGHILIKDLKIKKKYYCIGYFFNAYPPFQLYKISKIFTFFERNDTKLLKLMFVEFPTQIQKIDNNLFISIGIDDNKSYLLKIDFNILINQIFN
jgi:hypothetical protein